MSTFPFTRFDYNGATTYTPVGFEYRDPSQVKVILADSNGTPRTLVYNRDYTVIGDSINLMVTRDLGIDPVKMFVIRDTELSDTPAFERGIYLDVKKVQQALETMRLQIAEVKMEADNSIKLSHEEWHGEAGDNPFTLPPEAERRNRILAFDDEGNALMVLTTDIEQNLQKALEAENNVIAIKKDVDDTKAEMDRELSDARQAALYARAEVKKAESYSVQAAEHKMGALDAQKAAENAEASTVALNERIQGYNDVARQWVEGPVASGKTPGVDNNATYLAGKAREYSEQSKKWAEGTTDRNNPAYNSSAKDYAEKSEENARKWALGTTDPSDPAYRNSAKDHADESKGYADEALEFKKAAFQYRNEAEEQADKAKRYYIPHVDSEGNISWESTRPDMEQIPEGNIYGDTILNALNAVEEIKSSQGIKFGYAEYSNEDYFIHFYNEKGGTEIGVVGPVVGGAGTGGGGASTASTITMNAVDFGSSKTVAYNKDCILTFRWESNTSSGPTGDGSLTVNVGGRNVILDRDIKQGTVSVNVKDYLAENATNTVKLTVRDLYGSTSILICRIKAISFYLYAPQFHEDEIQTGSFLYSYYPYGEGDKTMHLVIDGDEEITKETSANGRPESIEVPALSHGTHTIEVWFDSMINEMTVECEHLKYQVIATEEDHSEPIIAMRLDVEELKQYYTTSIRYQVWTNRQISNVTLDDGVSAVVIEDLDKTEHTWSVRKDEIGEASFTISVGDTSRTLTVQVVDSGIVLNPATSNLELFLSSKGHVIGSPLEWGYGDIQCQFNEEEFTTACGWQLDKDNIPVMRLKGAARMTVPFKVFGKEVSVNGKTIELEFSTSNVFNYDTVVMDCMSGGRGFEATAQAVTLKSSENELYTQYKEDEHVRVSFVISSSKDETQGRIVYCYINGIMSGAYQYSTDLFEQSVPEDIVIGSDDCTTDVYCIRVYDRALNRREVQDNWLADIQNGAELLQQYESNDIYVNDRVNVEKLLSRKLPCLVIIGDLPQDKGDVKTVSGYYTDPEDSSRSFDFSGAEIDVQGTSSKDYAVKNYKIKFNGGFKLASGTTVGKYAIDGGMPVDTFTFKADYASSEGANNVELVRLYNDIDPWKSPLQYEDTRVRQGIDGFPIAIFHQQASGPSFVGKYNFNNDKGTAEVFGFTEGDQSWEITGNGAASQLFKEADFNTYAEVHEDFEARYPKEPKASDPLYTDPAFVADLKAMISWVASTDTTVEGLSEEEKASRLEKFKSEFDQWFDRESAFFYYLFTEFFLMVDSRAKNAFPTKYDADGKWVWLPYDMDTALGIDNGGRLMFSYNLEDTDVINGATVFNGQNSVLWNNLRDCFSDELEEFYERKIRNNPRFTYESIEKQFEDHQYKWPVALWNEDAEFKYVNTLINRNDDRLYMLQGSKESQRKWWMFNRFRYIDSKYNAGLAKQKTIVFRAYANNMVDHSEFDITPYADIYASVDFDEKHDKKKASRGETTTLRIDGIANPNNLVVRIYSADQLASVGDLSGFLPDEVKLGDAVNLQSIKVGGDDVNPQLKSLTLGANVLLREIDARNCINLNTSIDASGCESIEQIRLDNTRIPSVSVPDGAPLASLHLPESITSLELRNLNKLEDFFLDGVPVLSRLWVENPSDAIASKVTELVLGMEPNSRLRVRGLVIEVDDEDGLIAFLRKMDTLKGLDQTGNPTEEKAQVSGTITLHDTMTKGDFDRYYDTYPDLTLVPDHLICRVTFMTEDGLAEINHRDVDIGTQFVRFLGDTPTKEQNAEFTYEFVGWSLVPNSNGIYDSNALDLVVDNITVYAAFAPTRRSYTIQFVNDNGAVLQSSQVLYGDVPVFVGTPVTSDTSGDTGEFTGWDSELVPVTGPKTYRAKYRNLASPTRRLLMRTLTTIPDVVDDITIIPDYAFYGCSKISTVSFSEATSIGKYSFYGCSKLASASFPKANSITEYAFNGCSSLSELVVGVENNSVCNLNATSAIPSNIKSIFVPDELVENYKTHIIWKSFAAKIKPVSERE